MKLTAPEGELPHLVKLPEHTKSVRVEVVQNGGAAVGDTSGQFQYRSFNLGGKPLSPFPASLPSQLGMFTPRGLVVVNPEPGTVQTVGFSRSLSEAEEGRQRYYQT